MCKIFYLFIKYNTPCLSDCRTVMGRPLYTALPSTDLLPPWKFSWISTQIPLSGTWRMSRRLTWPLATVEWMWCSVWWTDVRTWCRFQFWSTLHSILLQRADTDRLWRSYWTRDLMLTLRYKYIHHKAHEIHAFNILKIFGRELGAYIKIMMLKFYRVDDLKG